MPQKNQKNRIIAGTGEWFAQLELYAGKTVVLHDCKALSDFSGQLLSFVTVHGKILIEGEGLQLADYSEGVAVIHGEIQTIRLQPKNGGE